MFGSALNQGYMLVLAIVGAGIAGIVTAVVQLDVGELPFHWRLAARLYPVHFED